MTIADVESTVDLSPFKVRMERHTHLASMMAAYCNKKDKLEKLEALFLVGAIANIVNHGLIGHYRRIDWTQVSTEERIRMFLPRNLEPEQAVRIAEILGVKPYDILHTHICDRLAELKALH